MNRSIATILLALFACACASHTMSSDIPEPIKLRSRIAQLCEAQMKQDWLSWYNLTTLKKEVSYDEFKAELSKQAASNRIISCNTERFVPKPVPEYQKKDIKAMVAVEMDVQVIRGFSKPEKLKDATDYWLYSGGEWYWAWRGFPGD
jgi:hypothetical protein